MISFKQFGFAYSKKFPLYTNLNLELSKGKIYGLFGKNGAGKSTLLKNITGLTSPTTGAITVNDKIPYLRKPSFLNDLFLISEETYIPSVSPKNYIKTYRGYYPHFSQSDFDQYITELEVPATKKLNQLSFGQQKKFIIAFALATNTSVLIMDEPTNGLDIPSKIQFRKLIAKCITEEKTFIISTHQVRDLDHLLDHILILNSGEIMLDASIQEIEDKLSFKFYTNRPLEESVISINENIGGFSVIEKNTSKEQTDVNLEQLFTTTILNPNEITTLFN